MNELDVAELNELDSLEEDEEHGGGLTPAGLADPLLLINLRRWPSGESGRPSLAGSGEEGRGFGIAVRSIPDADVAGAAMLGAKKAV